MLIVQRVRHQLIERALDDCADKAGVAIDCGCGPGLYLEPLSSRFSHVVGLDLAPALIDAARKRARESKYIDERKVTLKVQDLACRTASERNALGNELAKDLNDHDFRGFLFSASLQMYYWPHASRRANLYCARCTTC